MKTTTKLIKKIAIFGDSQLPSTDPAFKLAFDTAKLLAESGYTVIDGGGPGIMLAATLGAKAGQGQVEIVVISPDDEPGHYEGIDPENHRQANKVHITRDYQSRMHKLMEIADAFVVFKGGTGTLSEVGLTWEMAKFDYGHHEPLIFVGPEWREVVATLEKDMKFESMEKRVVTVVSTPAEVLGTIKKL